MQLTSFRVKPTTAVDLDAVPTRSTDGFSGDKAAGRARTAELALRIAELQRMLFAGATERLLLVLQAPDAGGKDAIIAALLSGVNPQGTRVANFKQPSDEELAHDYLWRVHRHAPAKGEIAVFNRSHYEDVLVVAVHDLVPERIWSRRYEHINGFEKMLADEGTTIIKLFLHLSPEEQAVRFQERIDDPTKHWKFRRGDLDERARWTDYRVAFEAMLARTSTEWAPWYIIPADRTWYRNLVAAEIVVSTLESLGLRYPDPEPGLEGLKIR